MGYREGNESYKQFKIDFPTFYINLNYHKHKIMVKNFLSKGVIMDLKPYHRN